MAEGVNVGTAWVSLTVEAKGISKDIEKELGGVRGGFDQAEKKSRSFGEALTANSTKLLALGAAGGAALYGLASAAGDLEAAIAANEQILGSASSAIQDFARDGVENVGLSEVAVLNAATAFGQFGTIIGLSGDDLSTFSTDLVTLAADLAAFANVPASQAVQDLQAAFAGQTEVVRKYGVFLDEASLKTAYFNATGETVTGTLTAQQRIIATSNALFEQTGSIQGQAAREADSFQRAQDNLIATVQNAAADFGAPIVGFATSLLSSITGGVEQLSAWNDATGGMLATGIAAGIGIAAASGAALGVAGKVRGAITAFQNLGRGMQLATGAVGALALAVTAGFVAYGLMTQHSRELREQTQAAGSALDAATVEAWEYAEATAAASGDVDALAVAQQALGTAVLNSFNELSPDLIGRFGIQADELGASLLRLRGDPIAVLAELGEEAGLTAGQASILAIAMTEGASTADDLFAGSMQNADAATLKLQERFHLTEPAARAMAEAFGPVVGGLEDIYDASLTMSENDIASVFLNEKVASGDLAESLIEQAEARADASRTGEGAFDVYVALLDIVAGLSGEERIAAEEALGLADAQSTAATTGAELNAVQASTIELMSDAERAFQDAADAADSFTSALDDIIGPALDMDQAASDLAAGWDAIAEAAAAAAEEGLHGAAAFDRSTAAGRENRKVLADQVQTIIDSADAQLEAGQSIEGTTALMLGQRRELIEQAMAFGLTYREAERYVNQLGLTPENINTAVSISNDEATKRRIEALQTELGEIPETVATRVQTFIDAGQYARAEAELNRLARNRNVNFYAQTFGVNAANARFNSVNGQAFGGYFEGNTPESVVIGEAPWDEAVITVGNMGNLRKQLGDPRISGPILEALDFEPSSAGGRSAPLVGEMNVYGASGESVEDSLGRVLFRERYAAVG